jgi:hypothetical protein
VSGTTSLSSHSHQIETNVNWGLICYLNKSSSICSSCIDNVFVGKLQSSFAKIILRDWLMTEVSGRNDSIEAFDPNPCLKIDNQAVEFRGKIVRK